MATTHFRAVWLAALLIGLLVLMSGPPGAIADGKVGLYGHRLEPFNTDADEFSDANWGGGAELVLPVPYLQNLFAGTIGLDVTDLMTVTTEFRDRLTGLRVEQQTHQNYFRFYLGGRVGGHGHGFLRPHAGMHLAFVHYNISTDVVIPDDSDRENEIRQNLRDKGRSAFGYDMTLGVDLNFNDKFFIDGGVRYLKSFNVPQQLGADAVTIHPDYVMVYLGGGVPIKY